MLHYKCIIFFMSLIHLSLSSDVTPECKWDVHNCGHNEVLCNPVESVHLDAKLPFANVPPRKANLEHCFAIQDNDKGQFQNYEVSVEMLSLESTEGINSGNVGMIFNYLDDMNYDFIYLAIHPNSSAELRSGYLVNGAKFQDETIPINTPISGTKFHILRLVIDNASNLSTRVFLDGHLIGSLQEHFVPRLKGGVLILNNFEGVALFKNFRLKECRVYDEEGNCLNVIVQSHLKGKGANFVRDWNQYKNGFGAVEQQNYWIGLQKLHEITDSGSYGLQIALKMNGGDVKVVEYDSFRVTGENEKYKLLVSGFRPGDSGLPDRLSYHNGRAFSTYDSDNDGHDTASCSRNYGSAGWWFGRCFHSHLNHPNGPSWVGSTTFEEESTMILIKK